MENWLKHLNDSKRDISNLPCSSWPRTATTECNVQKVDTIITKKPKGDVRKIIAQPGTGHNVMQEMINDSEY
jgi:hypothetical protein